MADLPIVYNDEIEPDNKIEAKWCESQIQEAESRIIRHRQDIEDLVKGKIPQIEGNIMMLEKRKTHLEQKLEHYKAGD